VCLIGALLGLVSAQQMIAGTFGIIAQSKGPWRVWLVAGSPKADPYTRAHFLLAGRLSMGVFETLEYETRVDAGGSRLDADCTYAITGSMAKARWWSLAALPKEGARPIETDPGRHGLVAQRVVYEPDGTFKATLSREPQPGNWFKPSGSGKLVLLYRLYNPDPALRTAPLTADLPKVEREVCR
jgi:hypothetical protein